MNSKENNLNTIMSNEKAEGDPLVYATQKWLKDTYGNDNRFVEITPNGKTGWTTIYALRRALQIELGIQATSNAFGPSTTAKFLERFPNGVSQQDPNDNSEDNIYAIIQGGLLCKGYPTGFNGITKHFYSGTGNAIKNLKSEAGSSDSTSSKVTLNVMKALLSMDQFRKVRGGTDKIQQIQRNLNNEYEAYIGLSPCDGLYGREMNKALIKVLQAIEGYSVTDATGNFGSGTKSKLPIVPSGGSLNNQTESKAIKLVRYALCCNGYNVSINTDAWNSELATAIQAFQSDMCLTVVEKCNIDTWCSLLISKGNTDRTCKACDTRFEMTEDKLEYLKNNGYNIIGRYLTGGDFKELRYGEPQRIIAAGMKLFPIFQESTSNLTYFTTSRGKQDAKSAVKASRKHGIPENTVIYFAVDTDPTDNEISTYIMPYFKAISENIGLSYKVGVYGTRNVCTKIMNAGYAETCFVSDMSTGFSGNMGFKMPENWNFDQFHEFQVTTSSGKWDLDKDAYSEKFPAVDTVYDSMINYNRYIRQLETLYLEYRQSKNRECTVKDLILGVTNFLRSFKYNKPIWVAATLSGINIEFINYVKEQNLTLYNDLAEYAVSNDKSLTDVFSGFSDIGHLAATLEGYVSTTLIPDFWFGWGGDLASLMKDADNEHKSSNEDYLKIAKKILGEYSYSFPYQDICSDADAIYIAEKLKTSTSLHPISDIFSEYFLRDAELRISFYLNDLDFSELTLASLKEVIGNKMTGLFENTILLPVLGGLPSSSSKNACCEAFAQYIIDNYPII